MEIRIIVFSFLLFGANQTAWCQEQTVEVVSPAAGRSQFVRIAAGNDRPRAIDPAVLRSKSKLKARSPTGRMIGRTVGLQTTKRSGLKIKLNKTKPAIESLVPSNIQTHGGRLENMRLRAGGAK
ncbi:MAG: hypothetical protein HY747_03540 [Elusimicrobia bacterium]|nr:hypothetical protein [Elusimicrobiota bacterium]